MKANTRYNKSLRGILKQIEKEILEKDEWLRNLQSLLRCPFGNQKDLNKYAAQFISMTQSDSYLKEVGNINLRVKAGYLVIHFFRSFSRKSIDNVEKF